MEIFHSETHSIKIFHGDAMSHYDSWDSPVVIMSDGPYGVKGFKGDLFSADGLDEWYEPHIAKWNEKATPQTTLWFWGVEVGWAKVHPVLERYGWEYRACNVWDKGIQHVAGNINSKSLRQLPVVTELCVQYIKTPVFHIEGKSASMRDWLRYEWERTGLQYYKLNDAAGVKNAATRKWFVNDHLWYMPPAEDFMKIVVYANENGRPEGRPYFTMDGKVSVTKKDWERQRAKFYCPFGITNVWSQPPVNGDERLKNGGKAVHNNQKPLNLMELTIKISSDESDLVWEPFGGLCTAAIASHRLKRSYVASEIDHKTYELALNRVTKAINMPQPEQAKLFDI